MTFNDGKKAQSQILRVQFRCEIVADTLLFAGRDLQIVSRCRKVTNDTFRWCARSGEAPETTTDESNVDRFRFVIGDGEKSLRRVTVYELDTEDLRLREGCRDFDGEVGRLSRDINIFVGGCL